MYSEFSDEQLAAQSIKDEEAFAVLMNRYEAKLSRYINRIAKLAYEDTQDLLQDIFISVYQNIAGFNPDMKFSSWIYRIAHNRTINHWKKNKKRESNIDIDSNQYFVDSVYNGNSVQEFLDEQVSRETVEAVMNNMSAKYREVLYLRFFEEKDYKEISDVLQAPMGTVAALLNRAKKQFLKEKEKLYGSNI